MNTFIDIDHQRVVKIKTFGVNRILIKCPKGKQVTVCYVVFDNLQVNKSIFDILKDTGGFDDNLARHYTH